MSALTFDKNELGNLEYSLRREMLSTDRIGGYMSTTIVCCNTRRYHGLMVAPIDTSDRAYVLLSSLDETVVQHDQSFNLALHRFPGVYEPRGHKYITDFEYTPTPTITYRVGGVILRKELLWIHRRTQLMIRYTLVDAHSETRLRLRPFLAFRDKESLTHANMEADGRSYPIAGGVKYRLYPSFPWLYMQTDCPGAEFVAAPDWYYNFEYREELERGNAGHEDLLTTGYFELKLEKGKSVIFSASLDEMASPSMIDELYAASIARRTHKIDFVSCLQHSARQFLIRRGGRTELISGYPWGSMDPRQMLIALPGLTLEQEHKEDCIDALDTLVAQMRDGMFTGRASADCQIDTPLWFFWTLQRLAEHWGAARVWEHYGPVMRQLLDSYRRGVGSRVRVHDNGLVWCEAGAEPLTWMDATLHGHAVTPRHGYQVEVNALWYNAVCYALELARAFGDTEWAASWADMPDRIRASFDATFRLEGCDYLPDVVNESGPDASIRPNMIVACGLPYKPIDEERRIGVLRTVNQHLLTPKGLRSLSPRNPIYKGTYEGTPEDRALAAKNGSVWIWPLMFHTAAALDILGESYLPKARALLDAFKEEIQFDGIGSLSEVFDADPPYTARGAVSSAWSVGSVLEIRDMVERYGVRTEGGTSSAPATRSGTKRATTKSAAARTKPAAKKAPAKTSAKRTTAKTGRK